MRSKLPQCLALSGILILAIAVSSFACSCDSNPNPPCRAYANTEVVFTGTVLESDPFDPEYRESSRKAVLRIDSRIKGELAGTRVTVASSSRCGPFFEKGASYLVYSWKDGDRLETGMCSRTTLLKDATEDLEYFGRLSSVEDGIRIFGHVKKFALGYGDDENYGRAVPLANMVVRLRGAKSRTLLTGKQGEFEVKNFPEGQYLLELKLPKSLRMSPNTQTQMLEILDVKNRSCAEATFYVRFQGEISGKVLDRRGKGAAGLNVQLVSADYRFEGPNDTGPMLEWAISRSDGSYTLEGIPPGRYRLGIEIAGAFDSFGKDGQIFYPNTKNPNEAKIIVVTEKRKLRNMNLLSPK